MRPKLCASLDQAICDTTIDILNHGHASNPRNMGSKELLSASFTIADPRHRLSRVRQANEHYSAASVAWNLAYRDDVDSICWWNEHGRKISDDGVVFHGANYGQRWKTPLKEAMDTLKHDQYTRRAWIPIWDWAHDAGMYSIDGKDVPCTVGFCLRVIPRDGEDQLDMQVIMRSQSVLGVLPYDVFLFTVLQELIANTLELTLGQYHHTMMSAHVYDREMDLARSVVDTWLRQDIRSTAAPMQPLANMDLLLAEKMYPKAFDMLMDGKNPYAEGILLNDPLVGMMAPFALEKMGAGVH